MNTGSVIKVFKNLKKLLFQLLTIESQDKDIISIGKENFSSGTNVGQLKE